MSCRIHSNLGSSNLQILGFLNSLADSLRIITACTLQSIYQQLACIIAQSGEYIWCMAIFLGKGINKALSTWILREIMSREVSIVQSRSTGNISNLWIIPAISTQHSSSNTDFTSLLYNLAYFLIISWYEDYISISSLNLGQRSLEILILGQEGLLHYHLAASSLKSLLEYLAQALGIVRAGINVHNSCLSLQLLAGKLSHNSTLLWINEAAAENIRLYSTVLNSYIRIGSCKSNYRHLVISSHLGFSNNISCYSRAYNNLDTIIRNQLGSSIYSLSRLRFVICLHQLNLLAVNTASLIGLLNSQAKAFQTCITIVGLIASHLNIGTNLDFITGTTIPATACKYCAQHSYT